MNAFLLRFRAHLVGQQGRELPLLLSDVVQHVAIYIVIMPNNTTIASVSIMALVVLITTTPIETSVVLPSSLSFPLILPPPFLPPPHSLSVEPPPASFTPLRA